LLNRSWIQTGTRITAGLTGFGGVVLLVVAPVIGDSLFDALWGVEPLTYIGAVLLLVGLGVISASYLIPAVAHRRDGSVAADGAMNPRWSLVTQQYFQMFDHDLGRPLRRILGKERELRAVLRSSGALSGPEVRELLDEIERQAPNFRLMMSNVQVLVQLEAPDTPPRREPVEPAEVVRRIVDRYTPVADESFKEISWWAEPQEFGIVYSDSAAIEHIVVNLVDNAVRFASTHIEIKLSMNPSQFFIRVWDDGPGIAHQYQRHIFDHGWTPQVARREEKTSSGLGLFIARTLAKRSGGDITIESATKSANGSGAATAPDPDHYSAFLVGLPLEIP
jgi:signal transduction histidine kinase